MGCQGSIAYPSSADRLCECFAVFKPSSVRLAESLHFYKTQMFQDVLVDRPRANLHGQPSFYISFILCAYTSEEKKVLTLLLY
jgi:hypothetical protein